MVFPLCDRRKSHGIIYRRGGAGKETVPRKTRLGGDQKAPMSDYISPCKPGEYDPVLDTIIGEPVDTYLSMMLCNVEEPYSTGDQTTLSMRVERKRFI